MKVINFAVAAAAIMVFPVLFCSCNSDGAQTKNKQEIQTPKQKAEAEPSAVEVTSETTIPEPVAPTKVESAKDQETPAKAEPATAQADAEPAKAPETPANAEPATAPETPANAESAAPAKAEPAKAQEAPAKTEPAKAQKAAAKAQPVKTQASAKAVLPCEHTVRTGDNLWKISHRYYGSGKNWKKIYEANKSQIKKPEFLEPGTVLKIPAK